ncbi:MAG: hypothetical protein ACPIOQ_43630 [Promethearchaeia archaeon]
MPTSDPAQSLGSRRVRASNRHSARRPALGQIDHPPPPTDSRCHATSAAALGIRGCGSSPSGGRARDAELGYALHRLQQTDQHGPIAPRPQSHLAEGRGAHGGEGGGGGDDGGEGNGAHVLCV